MFSIRKLILFVALLGGLLLLLQIVSNLQTPEPGPKPAKKPEPPASVSVESPPAQLPETMPGPKPPDPKPDPKPAPKPPEPKPAPKPGPAPAASPSPPVPAPAPAPAVKPMTGEKPATSGKPLPVEKPDDPKSEPPAAPKAEETPEPQPAPPAPPPEPEPPRTSAPMQMLDEEMFRELDRERDKLTVNAPAREDGMYSWGVVSDYRDPDLPHRVLGGTPFAIDPSGPYYYRIDLENGTIKALAAADAAWSTVGVDAHDRRLKRILRDGVRSGRIAGAPRTIAFQYLFPRTTEAYLLNKVRTTFEWMIMHKKMPPAEAEDFRKTAGLRVDVVNAVRENGGRMGVAAPLYFDLKSGARLCLPEAFYSWDPELSRMRWIPENCGE